MLGVEDRICICCVAYIFSVCMRQKGGSLCTVNTDARAVLCKAGWEK